MYNVYDCKLIQTKLCTVDGCFHNTSQHKLHCWHDYTLTVAFNSSARWVGGSYTNALLFKKRKNFSQRKDLLFLSLAECIGVGNVGFTE